MTTEPKTYLDITPDAGDFVELLAAYIYTAESHKCPTLDAALFHRSNWRRAIPEAREILNAIGVLSRIEKLNRDNAQLQYALEQSEAKWLSLPPSKPQIEFSGWQAKQFVEFCGGEYAVDLRIGHFDAAKDEDTGEDMPAGLYIWCAEYPEEGRVLCPDLPTMQAPMPTPWQFLVAAARQLVADVRTNHDTKTQPLKYTVPYGAVNVLAKALAHFDHIIDPPRAPVEPGDCKECDKLLTERDDAEDMADKLAAAIATLTGIDIGEHSSGNSPWDRALEAAEQFLPPIAPPSAHEFIEMVCAAGWASRGDAQWAGITALHSRLFGKAAEEQGTKGYT